MRNIFSNENLKRLINNKLENINTEFEKDWQQAIEDVKEKISQDIINFINTENDILNERLDEYNTSSELLKNGVGQGAAIGGSLGLTIAAYEAWFGYYSSIATLGMTASAWIPPLLIGGVVVGGVAKLFSYKKEKNKLRKIIKEKFREIKRDKIEGEVVNNIIVNIKEHSDQISEEIHSNFVNGIAENWSEKSLYELEKNIDQYCTEIKSIASKNYDL
jgi:gas vesicle protein